MNVEITFKVTEVVEHSTPVPKVTGSNPARIMFVTIFVTLTVARLLSFLLR